MQQSPSLLFVSALFAVFFPLTAWGNDFFDDYDGRHYPSYARSVGGSHYPGSVRLQTDVTGDGYYLRAYIEGVRPEDVQVYIRGNRLVFEVVKGDQSLLQNTRAREFSRWKMRFRKQLRLPYDADRTHMTSSTRDGVMEIHIPRQRPNMPGDVDFSRRGFYSPYPLRK